MNTDPLCPLVILMVSSMYPVRSHPVGPIMPNGNVMSIGEFCSCNLHESNFTSILRLSLRLGLNPTSTMSDPLTGRGLRNSTLTTFLTRLLFISIAWLLRTGVDLLLVSLLSSRVTSFRPDGSNIPKFSNVSCISLGNIGFARPAAPLDVLSPPLGLLL